MKSENVQYSIVSNTLKKMKEKESTMKINLKTLKMFQIMTAIWKTTIILKTKLKKYMKKKAEGTRIRSTCLWYEEGEKSSKFFLNLEKLRGVQGQLENLF